jgi:hypothetical protein
MKQWIRVKAAPVACALMMAAALGTARSAIAKDAVDNDPAQQEQQVQQQELRLTATLGGVAPFNGAFGFAEFEQEGARTRLKLEVEHVNLADGTLLQVLVNGNPLAGVSLKLAGGQATLVLDSSQGQTVPVIGAGSTIAVTTTGGATVVHGQF